MVADRVQKQSTETEKIISENEFYIIYAYGVPECQYQTRDTIFLVTDAYIFHSYIKKRSDKLIFVVVIK